MLEWWNNDVGFYTDYRFHWFDLTILICCSITLFFGIIGYLGELGILSDKIYKFKIYEVKDKQRLINFLGRVGISFDQNELENMNCSFACESKEHDCTFCEKSPGQHLKLDVTSTKSGKRRSIQGLGLNCQTDNLIFIIQCSKCQQQAIGWGKLSDYEPDSLLKAHFYNHHPEISEPGIFISITFIDGYLSEEDKIEKLTEHQEFFEPEIKIIFSYHYGFIEGEKIDLPCSYACSKEDCNFCKKSIVETNPHSPVVTSNKNEKTYTIMESFGCLSYDLIFIIQCSICKKQAIGWGYLYNYDPESILKDHFCSHHPEISEPGKFISITFINEYSSEEDRIKKLTEHQEFFDPEIKIIFNYYDGFIEGEKILPGSFACSQKDCKFCEKSIIESNPHSQVVTSNKNKKTYTITESFGCLSHDLIFIIQCNICKKQAIGWGELSEYEPNSILKDHFYEHHSEISEPGKFISITFIDLYSSKEDRIKKLTEHKEFFEPEIIECEDRFGQKLSPLACNREDCKFCEKSIVESKPHSSVVTSNKNKKTYTIMGSFGCQSRHLTCIFIIQCSICKKQAIGWDYLYNYDPGSILKDHFCNHHPKISEPCKFISIIFIDRYSSEEDRIEKLTQHQEFFEPEIQTIFSYEHGVIEGAKIMPGSFACSQEDCEFCKKSIIESNPHSPVVTSNKNKKTYTIMESFGCRSDRLIFIVQCSKCQKQSIGWGYLYYYDPDSILKDHFHKHHPEISEPGKFISLTFIDRYSSEEDRIGKLTEHQEFFEPEIVECEDRYGDKYRT